MFVLNWRWLQVRICCSVKLNLFHAFLERLRVRKKLKSISRAGFGLCKYLGWWSKSLKRFSCGIDLVVTDYDLSILNTLKIYVLTRHYFNLSGFGFL